jgi:hypothetical protein
MPRGHRGGVYTQWYPIGMSEVFQVRNWVASSQIPTATGPPSGTIYRRQDADGHLFLGYWIRRKASVWVRGMFYKSLVQSILLFGCETWMVVGAMLKVLDSFHH